tara:strand:- start:270 stop:722 length:453 start_codon:yes stop_codon:yes gene_type:complete
MSLKVEIQKEMKAAMIAKDKGRLEALRAVKSAILLAETEKGGGDELTEEAELTLLQKLVKQRKDSATLYTEQGREDLAEVETAQAAVIEAFLPEQMSEDEIRKVVQEVIASVGASSPADMGKVMGPSMGKMKGKADGKLISKVVKEELNK